MIANLLSLKKISRLVVINNIPYWYYDFMKFKTFRLTDFFKFNNHKMPLFLKLYEKNSIENIPVYQYLITDKKEIVDVAYPKKGRYKLLVEDKNNRIIYNKGIEL